MKRVIIFICIMLVSTLFLVVFSSCSNKEYESGDFKYCKFGKGENAYAEITGLTEQGKTQKVLIVPEKIDGIPVTVITKRSFMNWGKPLIWNSNSLEKVYLPYDMCISPYLLDSNETVNVFIINKNRYIYSNGVGVHDGFSVSSLRNATIFIDKIYAKNNSLTERYSIANVTYFYNFERADNDGVFWIDNVDEGALIVDVPPTEPIRERWTFGGWYTEPECINAWNFSTDTVSADGASFYAKWL